MRRKHIRAITVSIFVIVITTFNFLNLNGSEYIRAIHIINLLVCGLGIGLLLENLIGLLRGKRN
jgi:hypothetical protein